MTAGPKSRPKDLRRTRRRRQHSCWDHLVVAPLWVAYGANLGTLLRTCDAVGACMAVPDTDHYRAALAHGDTLPRRPHIHWLDRPKLTWIEREHERSVVVGVELAEDATPLTGLEPARTRTVVLLGHEHYGIPDEAWPLMDEVVEIPMIGWQLTTRRRTLDPAGLRAGRRPGRILDACEVEATGRRPWGGVHA